MLDAFALFIDARWDRVSFGLGGWMRTEIIRSELEASARLLGIGITPKIFSDVRVMEDEAIRYWARKHR